MILKERAVHRDFPACWLELYKVIMILNCLNTQMINKMCNNDTITTKHEKSCREEF